MWTPALGRVGERMKKILILIISLFCLFFDLFADEKSYNLPNGISPNAFVFDKNELLPTPKDNFIIYNSYNVTGTFEIYACNDTNNWIHLGNIDINKIVDSKTLKTKEKIKNFRFYCIDSKEESLEYNVLSKNNDIIIKVNKREPLNINNSYIDNGFCIVDYRYIDFDNLKLKNNTSNNNYKIDLYLFDIKNRTWVLADKGKLNGYDDIYTINSNLELSDYKILALVSDKKMNFTYKTDEMNSDLYIELLDIKNTVPKDSEGLKHIKYELLDIENTVPKDSEGLEHIKYDEGYFTISWMPYEYFFNDEKYHYYLNSIRISYTTFDKEKQTSVKQEGSYFLINGKTVKVVINGNNEYAKLNETNFFELLKEGVSSILIQIGADIKTTIDIKQTMLPLSQDDNLDALIEKIGFPDKKEDVIVEWPDVKTVDGIFYDTTRNVENFYATHYFYKQYPYLCISYVKGSFRCGESFLWTSELSE